MTRKGKEAKNCAPHRTTTKVSKVKVAENGKSAVFLNPARTDIHITKVDGGLIVNDCAADYAISKIGLGDVIVELKGKEVGRACEQIVATAAILRKCGKPNSRIAGLVVCTRVPSTDTKAIRLKNRFMQEHGAKLMIAASNREYRLEDFF